MRIMENRPEKCELLTVCYLSIVIPVCPVGSTEFPSGTGEVGCSNSIVGDEEGQSCGELLEPSVTKELIQD